MPSMEEMCNKLLDLCQTYGVDPTQIDIDDVMNEIKMQDQLDIVTNETLLIQFFCSYLENKFFK